MEYSTKTPANVRRAVAIYVGRRRWVGVATALLAGGAGAGVVAAIFMIADRYAPLPSAVRSAGPWIAVAALAGGMIAALAALVRRHHPFRIAVQLDRAFPQHLDRWSSSLDLAEQIDSGRPAGNQASLERLFADTQTLQPNIAGSIVPRRRLWGMLAAFTLAALILLFIGVSPAFDFPLLCRRFLHPHANLPRDSATRIVPIDINGNPFTDIAGPFAEGSPLSLRVELRRKPGLFAFGQHEQVIDAPDQLAPRLERATPGGTRVTEFSRAGTAWVFTQPRLDDSLEFRIGVDDAQTQMFRAEVTPRIKLSRMEVGVRSPRYAHIKDPPIGPMQANRISVLADSNVDFRASFDRALADVSVTYEAIKAEKEPGEAQQVTAGNPKAAASSSRRSLRVQKRGDAIRFALPVDASGILRLRAMGTNGLASEEWVCAVEAVPDSPPRIVVTGLDPDTTIMPGETVSFQYRAEDDLAVSDLVMDWSVAGGIHQGNLGGDEYLKNSQIGQKIVSGQELIQRMDYAFYATEPFQFFLSAVDSKGQESHSETYRIHIASDDYATRFERGMQLLKDAGTYEQRFKGQIGALTGQLNIISRALGDSKKWDPNLNVLFDNSLRAAQSYDDPWFFVKQLTLRYGGIPYRLDRSLQVILAVPDALATRADVVSLVLSMRTTDDLPGVIEKLRALLEGQKPLLDAWGKAIEAEKARFVPEELLNQAREPAARLAALKQVQQPPEVAAANLKFYLGQVDAWLAAAAPLARDNPEFEPLFSALKTAREHGGADAVIAALHPIIEMLSARDLGPDDALVSLATAMTAPPPGVSAAQDRFPTMVARLVTAAGQEELIRPAQTLALARIWLDRTAAADWYPPPASAADALLMSHQVWETVRVFQADLLAGRFTLNAQERLDHEVALRERALSAKEELRRIPEGGVNPAARDKLIAALDRVGRPGGAADPSLAADLSSALSALGTAPLADLESSARPMIDRLITATRQDADAYDQHAAAVTREASRPLNETEPVISSRMLLLDEAARLQVRTEALESLYRALKLAVIQARLVKDGAMPPWSAFEPLHGAQLAYSLAASQAGESVTRIHAELAGQPTKAAEKYPIAAANAKELARRLRSTAGLLEAAMHDKPIEFDYAQLMKEARAEGLLGALRDEYELVRSCAGPADARADARAKLDKSALVRIVRGEEALAPLAAAEKRLKKAAAGKPPEVIAALQAVQKELPSGPDASALEAVPAALKEAVAAPAAEPVASLPALVRRLTAVNEALASLGESLRDQARLPVINTTAQQNRRFTTRELPNVWVIGGVIEGFDRRWLYTMRDLELSLTRTMVEVIGPKTGQPPPIGGSARAADLKLQYARMVEWRARNFANDRRRNQGISLLAPQAGPTLRLPEYIADEFLRARNLQTPEDFKPRIETYYEKLYHDLAK